MCPALASVDYPSAAMRSARQVAWALPRPQSRRFRVQNFQGIEAFLDRRADGPDDQGHEHSGLEALAGHVSCNDKHAAVARVGDDLEEVPPTSRAGRYSLSMARPGIFGSCSGMRTCWTSCACFTSSTMACCRRWEARKRRMRTNQKQKSEAIRVSNCNCTMTRRETTLCGYAVGRAPDSRWGCRRR